MRKTEKKEADKKVLLGNATGHVFGNVLVLY